MNDYQKGITLTQKMRTTWILSPTSNTNDIEETANNVRHQIATHLHHHKRPVDMTKAERDTLRNLINDNNIIILPAN